MRRCTKCGEEKPLEDFAKHRRGAEGHRRTCKACQRADAREYRATIAPEDRAEAQRAYRAGIRQDRCAVCQGEIEGQGLCGDCEEAVKALGGLPGLKQAVRAVRYLEGE